MVNVLAVIGEIIGFLTAFTIAIIILRRDSSYKGNRYFAVSFFLYGFYSLVLMIYEFGISEIIVLILVYFSLVLLSFGTAFFVISMQIFAYSTSWLKSKTPKIILIGSTIIAILSVLMPIEVSSLDPVETTKNYVALISMGVWQYSLLIYSLVKISQILKKIDPENKVVRKKIRTLWIAQLIGLMAPTASVIGNILGNNTVVATIHIFLAIAYLIVARAILGSSSNK